MTWKNRSTTEWLNQWIDEPMSQSIGEWVSEWVSESSNPKSANESLAEWVPVKMNTPHGNKYIETTSLGQEQDRDKARLTRCNKTSWLETAHSVKSVHLSLVAELWNITWTNVTSEYRSAFILFSLSLYELISIQNLYPDFVCWVHIPVAKNEAYSTTLHQGLSNWNSAQLAASVRNYTGCLTGALDFQWFISNI